MPTRRLSAVNTRPRPSASARRLATLISGRTDVGILLPPYSLIPGLVGACMRRVSLPRYACRARCGSPLGNQILHAVVSPSWSRVCAATLETVSMKGAVCGDAAEGRGRTTRTGHGGSRACGHGCVGRRDSKWRGRSTRARRICNCRELVVEVTKQRSNHHGVGLNSNALISLRPSRFCVETDTLYLSMVIVSS